jgi:hypothetical protein
VGKGERVGGSQEKGGESAGRSGRFFGILSGESRTDRSGVNGESGGEEVSGQSATPSFRGHCIVLSLGGNM